MPNRNARLHAIYPRGSWRATKNRVRGSIRLRKGKAARKRKMAAGNGPGTQITLFGSDHRAAHRRPRGKKGTEVSEPTPEAIWIKGRGRGDFGEGPDTRPWGSHLSQTSINEKIDGKRKEASYKIVPSGRK